MPCGIFNRLKEMYAVVWSLELSMSDSNLFLLVGSFGELGSSAIAWTWFTVLEKNTSFLMMDLFKHT